MNKANGIQNHQKWIISDKDLNVLLTECIIVAWDPKDIDDSDLSVYGFVEEEWLEHGMVDILVKLWHNELPQNIDQMSHDEKYEEVGSGGYRWFVRRGGDAINYNFFEEVHFQPQLIFNYGNLLVESEM